MSIIQFFKKIVRGTFAPRVLSATALLSRYRYTGRVSSTIFKLFLKTVQCSSSTPSYVLNFSNTLMNKMYIFWYLRTNFFDFSFHNLFSNNFLSPKFFGSCYRIKFGPKSFRPIWCFSRAKLFHTSSINEYVNYIHENMRRPPKWSLWVSWPGFHKCEWKTTPQREKGKRIPPLRQPCVLFSFVSLSSQRRPWLHENCCCDNAAISLLICTFVVISGASNLSLVYGRAKI